MEYDDEEVQDKVNLAMTNGCIGMIFKMEELLRKQIEKKGPLNSKQLSDIATKLTWKVLEVHIANIHESEPWIFKD